MGAAYHTNANQTTLGAEHLGENLVQSVAAYIIVAIAIGTRKMHIGHTGLTEGIEHLLGIYLCYFVYLGKAGGYTSLYLFCQFQNLLIH